MSVRALFSDLLDCKPEPDRGDSGDLGDFPHAELIFSGRLAGDSGRFLGDPGGERAKSRPESPSGRPAETRTNKGESPESPKSPAPGSEMQRGGEPFDREAWEERAAIAEFDGGLTRAEAEALAWAEDDLRRCGSFLCPPGTARNDPEIFLGINRARVLLARIVPHG